jgi:hypothetical protein
MPFATPYLEDAEGSPYPQRVQDLLAPYVALEQTWRGTALGDRYADELIAACEQVAQALVHETVLRPGTNLSVFDGKRGLRMPVVQVTAHTEQEISVVVSEIVVARDRG